MANTDDLAQRIEHLRSEGYCILENVIPSDEVNALRDSVLATADSEAYSVSRDFIGNNRDFPRYVGSERVLGLVDAMLGRFARIAFTGPIIRQSRDKRGNWHSDWPFGAGGAAYIPEPYPDVVAYMTSIWMLTPFSAETGGTLIIPRSHKWRIDPLGGNGPAADERHPDEIHVTGNPRQRHDLRQPDVARQAQQRCRNEASRRQGVFCPLVAESRRTRPGFGGRPAYGLRSRGRSCYGLTSHAEDTS